jgi:hypothetical protein
MRLGTGPFTSFLHLESQVSCEISEDAQRTKFHLHRGLGLVTDIFTPEDINLLPGTSAVSPPGEKKSSVLDRESHYALVLAFAQCFMEQPQIVHPGILANGGGKKHQQVCVRAHDGCCACPRSATLATQQREARHS